MTRTIQTIYRYRLNPTPAQGHRLYQFAGARRFVWNWALGRKRAYFQQTGKTLSYNNLAAELTRLKQQPDTAWLREMESQSLQQALRDLDSAYQHFFRRVKKGEQNKGFPRFKSRKTDTPRFRIPQWVTLEGAFISVPKIGLVGVVVHRPLDGVTTGATFKQEPSGHWYVSIVTEQQIDPRTNPPVWTHIGIDDLNAARTIDREGVRLFEQMVAAGYAETQNACGDLVRPIERVARVDETGSPSL